jgi:hypothetical protein
MADEIAELANREAELESLMKRRGGARITQEQELHAVKRKLGTLTLSARAARSSIADLNAQSLGFRATVTPTKSK